MGGRGDGEVVFALEVMEEAALGEAGSATDVIDGRVGIAPGPDDVESGVQELGFRIVLPDRFHTNQLTAYRPIGMQSGEKRRFLGRTRIRLRKRRS